MRVNIGYTHLAVGRGQVSDAVTIGQRFLTWFNRSLNLPKLQASGRFITKVKQLLQVLKRWFCHEGRFSTRSTPHIFGHFLGHVYKRIV